MGDEINLEIIKRTQDVLGKYVKRPQLTEKLLKKPPFRFLHDVVAAVIKETGFLKGLYTPEELNSENVKERDAKLSFLNKLIEATKTITKTDLKVKASKIIAGLEPAETNLLLQSIGSAVSRNLSSAEYVRRLKNEKNDPKKNVKKKSPLPEPRKKRNDKKETKKTTPKKDEPKETELSPVSDKTSPELIESEQKDEVISEEAKSNPTVRPESARPESNEDNLNEIESNAAVVPKRPASSLRPPSVRPSSARPGAPRLRPDSAVPVDEIIPMGKIKVIVENYDVDEDDTVVIHVTEEKEMEKEMEVPEANRGHLVEQILSQIGDREVGAEPDERDPGWSGENVQGRDTTGKEMAALKELIQNFTKTANPLGKLLNYLHEDVENMQNELQQWSRLKEQLFAEISKQRKITSGIEKPHREQLDELKKEVRKFEEEISYTRANLLRNGDRIQELLTK